MYCKHGTNLGNAHGIDFLCGFCEDGTTDTEYELMKENYSLTQQVAQLEERIKYLESKEQVLDIAMAYIKTHAPFTGK